jgi:5-formyltetrahydrofolate cyclo-ligase
LRKELKKEIRKDVLKKRADIKGHERSRKDSAIRERLFSMKEFKESQRILFFASFGAEVETLEIIKNSISMGKAAMIPKVGKDGLEIYEIKSMDELSPGYMGIPEPEPRPETMRRLDDIDMVVIPGVAFDGKGSRLGYGKGYYDKLLSKMKKKIPIVAPAYEEQVVEYIPSEPHDIKIDKIVTDERTIDCNGH